MLLMLTACTLTPDRFVARYGEQTCDWLERCLPNQYDATTCTDEQEEGFRALLSRGCVYREDLGRDCLDERANATCDDPFGTPVTAQSCSQVMDCSGAA